MKRLLNVAVLILFFLSSTGQSNLSFRTISVNDGLSNDYVEQVFEDGRGFIWVGTFGGLNRYDGKSFKHVNIPNVLHDEIPSVSRNFIKAIAEDDEHKLWIGTLAGLFIYDCRINSFSTLEFKGNDKMALSNNIIEAIVFDSHGDAWIATQKGLNKYNRKTKEISRFLHDASDGSTISGDYILSLSVDHKGDLWVGTNDGGLDKLSPNGASFTHHKNALPGAKASAICSIFEDSDGLLWVLSQQDGLFLKKTGADVFARVPLVDQKTGREFKSVFSQVQEDIHGNIWIGTFTDGLIMYNKKTSRLKVYNDNSPVPSQLPCNSINNIFRDKHGNMWLSTHGNGVCMSSPIVSSFLLMNKNQNKNSLQSKLVSCFVEDGDGQIWVGTDGNGLSRFNEQEKSFDIYTNKEGLSSNAVLAMCMIAPRKIAVATWSAGLDIFDTRTHQIKNYLYPSTRANGNVQEIRGLRFDAKTNMLWCCTFKDGVQIFDCSKNAFLDKRTLKKTFRAADIYTYVSKVVPDGKGNTWVLDNYFLAKVNDKSSVDYARADSSKGCLSCSYSTDLLIDKRGTVWITSFNGVLTYDSVIDCFKPFKVNDVSFSQGSSLLEDSHGNIWIETSKALFRYSPADHSVKNMNATWGMPKMQPYFKASFRSSDGRLFFGGLSGFIVLHEDSSYTFDITPPLYINRLNVNDFSSEEQAVPTSIDLSQSDNISLNYDQSYFTIEYGALNFIDNDKTLYKYKLEGFEKNWVNAGGERKANYTNIPPGTYTFLLKSTNSEGLWADSTLKLRITILPPWWKTAWFKIAFALAFVIVIILVIKLRERNIRNYNRRLQLQIDKKTLELKKNNDTLLDQKTTIEQNYESLREKQMVIEIKNAQLQEALYTKDKLLTVIAHDFKNPLSTLHGTAVILKNKIQSKALTELKPNINSIITSAESLLSHMTEVLDWSVSDDDQVQCKPEDVNLEVVIIDVFSLVNETAYQKNISLSTDIKITNYAWIDPRMMSTVLRNLIINCIKFTHKGGIITISVCEGDDWVCLTVKDNGIGMSQEQIDVIMSDKNLLSSDYRSGFGLQICKSFISRNKGQFTIESEIDKGSAFITRLPKGKLLENPLVIHREYAVEEPDFKYLDNKKTMLVIDDDSETISFLKEIFSSDFIVYEAYNGGEGIRVAQNTMPEIILSDINMPVMDGKQLCHILKTNNLTSHIPIILLSAQSQPQNLVDGLTYGADDYVTKPFNISVLQQKVFNILKNRELVFQHFKQSVFSVEQFQLPESIDDKIIRDITRIVAENISDVGFTVETLADQVKMSRSQLYRKTKAVLGISPIEYINNIKLQKALEMIRTGKYRVSEVAYEVGFSDPRYFSQCFTKKFGVNPSTYFNKE